jgi:DNA-binding CsgD family transcriptional regulator
MQQTAHPPSSDQLLNRIELIYSSTTQPEKQPETLRLLNELVGGSWAHTLSWRPGSGAVLEAQFSGTDAATREASRDYLSHWGALDPRVAKLSTLHTSEVLRCHEAFDERFVAGSSFYQDYFLPRGFRWTLAAVVQASADISTAIAFVRGPDAPPFEDWAAAALRKLLPHLRQAMWISAKLQPTAPAEFSAFEMLKLLPTPWLLTDHAGRCIDRNQAFDGAADQLAMRVNVGRLRFSDPSLQAKWETALFNTDATAVGNTFPVMAVNGRHWAVQLNPLHPVLQHGANMDRKMILAVFDRKEQDAQPAVQSHSLGAKLTPAELDVATGLLKGMPAKLIARQRGASVNTVRSQIMAILEKTGHKSQRGLIAAYGASAFGASSRFASSFQPTASFASDSMRVRSSESGTSAQQR